MPLTDTVNNALQRSLGYRLTRETPEQRRETIRAAERAAAKRARERALAKHRERVARLEAKSQRQLSAQKQRFEAALKAAEKKAAPNTGLPRHFDDVKRQIIRTVLPRTMTGPPKLDPLVEAVRYVVRSNIVGDIVECGVWRGGSMEAMALTLASEGDTSRELHLFDTFEGMPPPTEEDTRKRPSGETVYAADSLARHDKSSMVWAVAGLDDVKEAMAESGYPAERIHYHPGMVEDTIPEQAPERIAILRLDTDWYASTKHELETLYERLSPGGVLMIDDYNDWDGARKATDEFLESTGTVLFLVPMGPGRIAVKPPVAAPPA